MHLHRASLHSRATVTEVYCAVSSVVRQIQGKTRKDGARPALFQIFVLFYILFVLCRSVYCLCVNVYCTAATGSLHTSYHILSYYFKCQTAGYVCIRKVLRPAT